jgi:hypothetical protein
MSQWRLPSFYIEFIGAWFVAAIPMSIFGHVMVPDDVSPQEDIAVGCALLLAITLIAYVYAASRTRQRLREANRTQRGFAVIERRK